MEGFSGVVLFLCVSLPLSSAAIYSLQYIYTAVTPGIRFPEVTAVGLLDEQQFVYYDSNIRKTIPKSEWIKKIDADDPYYWDRETVRQQHDQDLLKFNLKEIMLKFRQAKGVHTLQKTYGCELHDDGTTRGYYQYGYDGEDFIGLDLKTGTWTAAQDLNTKNMMEYTEAEAKHWTSFLEKECKDWIKKFLSYGRETLDREVRPEVSVFQKNSSSPEVVCHATGFFPKAVNMTWQKDGEDVYEDVELRETLPNQDGSFQKRSILKVPAEELQKHTYTCVIQHSSVGKEIVILHNKKPEKLTGGDASGGLDGGLDEGSYGGSDGGLYRLRSNGVKITVFAGFGIIFMVLTMRICQTLNLFHKTPHAKRGEDEDEDRV